MKAEQAEMSRGERTGHDGMGRGQEVRDGGEGTD